MASGLQKKLGVDLLVVTIFHHPLLQ